MTTIQATIISISCLIFFGRLFFGFFKRLSPFGKGKDEYMDNNESMPNVVVSSPSINSGSDQGLSGNRFGPNHMANEYGQDKDTDEILSDQENRIDGETGAAAKQSGDKSKKKSRKAEKVKKQNQPKVSLTPSVTF